MKSRNQSGRKGLRRVLCLLAALALCMGAFASFATAEAQADVTPITFTVLDTNGQKEWGNDAISQEITRRTGVTLKYLPVGTNGSEKLIILLASGDIPDLIAESLFSTTESKYVAANAVLQLDDLVAEYGPDIQSEIGEEYLNLMRSQHGGKLYSLPNWYQRPFAPIANGALLIRKDLVKEFAPEKAEGEGYFTFDEFMEILGKVKETYPDMTPFMLSGDGLEWGTLWQFRGFMGIQNYSVQGDVVSFYYRDPRMLEAYKFLNEIVRNGYCDPEWATLKNEPFLQKCASAEVFACSGSYWIVMDADSALIKDGYEPFYPYKLVGPGVDPGKVTLGGLNMLGWGAHMIGKNVSDPARAMQFLNFMASEEGQTLSWMGIEGEHWDRVDGQAIPKPEVYELYLNGGDAWSDYKKTAGIDGMWDWMVRSSSDERYLNIGDYMRKTSELSPFDQHALRALGDTAYAQDAFVGIEPDANSTESLIAQKCYDIWMECSISIINAPTEEACVAEYEKMLEQLDNAGAAKVEAVFSEKFNARKDGFGWKE